MANYKIAIQMHQDSSGSDNALARISFNGSVIADNVEIAGNDHTSPTLYVYDVTSDDAPAADAWQTLKIELLNDNFVDADDDRNLCVHRVGYAYQDPDTGNYIRDGWADFSVTPPVFGAQENITDWTVITNFNTKQLKFKYTSSEGNENEDQTVGELITSRPIGQKITTSFAEWQIAFEHDKVINNGEAEFDVFNP